MGNRLTVDAKAEGFSPTLGAPKFELTGNVPEGMRIETSPDRPFSGVITWEPQEESLIDTYNISVQVTRDDLEKPLAASLVVRVEERNDPPQIANPGNQVVYSGQPLRFTVKATDEQPVTFSLGAGAPLEATIDPASGVFSWTPPGVVMEQSLEIEIRASDKGNPPAEGSIKVPVEVKADLAHFTRFVGSLSEADVSEAWLFDRWNQKNLVIREGDMLEIADIRALLKKVEQNVLLFERNGQTFELELGHDVRAMKPVQTAAPAATANAK